MPTSRVIPLNWATGAGLDTREYEQQGLTAPPPAAIQSMTMAIRTGKDKEYAIGYAYEFTWNMSRDSQVLHQLEPFPNGTFGAGSFETPFQDSFYWPGEPVEVIPGKVDAVSLTLKKYAMYSNNLMRSLLVSDGAGTNHELGDIPNNNAGLHYTGAGQNEYVSLVQQVRPVYIYQMYINPITGQSAYGRVFEECWFTSLGEDIPNADSNGPVLENGELRATRIRPYVAD